MGERTTLPREPQKPSCWFYKLQSKGEEEMPDLKPVSLKAYHGMSEKRNKYLLTVILLKKL